ncbi:MAG: glycosyltransferase family 39 protein [Megasphaera sp.]|jgi:4-amino-4-deoxy-L-arabinose transferase-like glycosyltransferase|uniref:ArnT family glycosyltransferase n=1 Tax=Megasphaera sueciensis TaxID=349094 RepID=UPI003D07F32E|nr:glycosyltransferase family 39 protein [Megasphaera sp.]MCI1823329.1 glycosyltransferase family 39 protein [Megasphaera sp.]
MKSWIKENKYGLFLFFLSALLLLSFLGMSPLIDPDEPVYGETAKEMLLAGDWLSPRIFGNFWYDKPPLFYWLEMISYSILGISDYTSRLPSALVGMITVGYVYIQGKNIFNKQIAFTSSLVLLTSLGFIYIGKASITDMTLLFTLTVAMLSFYQEKYYLAYAFCGFALLAKGPIGYGFPALIMLCYIIFCRHWSLLKTMKIPQGICIAFLIGLPWYILMYHVHGEAFLDTFIGYHNIARFTAPEHPGQNNYFFFFPILLIAMMPWSGAIIPAVARCIKKQDPFKDILSFCLIWASFIFIFFSISKTQLVTYIAPMFPPTAYIIGWYIYRTRIENHLPKLWIGTMIFFCILFISCNALPLHQDAEFFKPAILWGSSFFAVLTIVPAILLYKRKWQAGIGAVVVTMLLFVISAFGIVLPSLEEYITIRPMAQKTVEIYDGFSTIYIDKFVRPGMAFYSNIYGTEWNHAKAEDFAHPDKTYYLMTKSYYRQLCLRYPTLQQYPVLAETSTQILVINHP